MVDVLLVMAEYGADDAPLWHRLSSDIGNAHPQALGLSDNLRRDLKEWNDVFEATAAPDYQFDDEVEASHQVDAFDLAARVQLELGDDTHVWCGAGGGVDDFPSLTRRTTVVVSAAASGATIERWTSDDVELLTVGAAGGSSDAAKGIVGWRRLTERAGAPFGNAMTRSAGLQAAAALQRDLGLAARVIFFAGVRGPEDYGPVRRVR